MSRASDLWLRAAERARRARASGALVPLGTELHALEEGGMHFAVRVRGRGDAKAAAKAAARSSGANPFLPYDEAMYVADLGETHVCLLNKYPVLTPHLLVVTRAYEDQQSPLSAADFAALFAAMEGEATLGFYNAGATAGASESHKHLQVVRLPLASAGPTPLDAALGGGAALPFGHAATAVEIGAGPDLAAAAAARYRGLRARCGLEGDDAAYNLLVTSGRMILVPRRRESWRGVSVNALGFAGSLMVKGAAKLEALRAAGPLAVLRHTGVEP